MNLILTFFLFTSVQGDTSLNKHKLLGSDYRLFKNTPVWELAKVITAEDTAKIRLILKKDNKVVDYKEPIYGQTLLNLSVYNRKYYAVKLLLEFGADPNMQDKKDRMSPLMEASRMGGGGNVHPYADTRFLEILLKYGGDPNAVQDGEKMRHNKTFFTPLQLACLSGVFDYVKILVDAGANVRQHDKFGTNLLFLSIVGGNPDITLFLLEHGVDFKQPLYTDINGHEKYLTDVSIIWHFDIDSRNYQTQQQILAFVKAHSSE